MTDSVVHFWPKLPLPLSLCGIDIFTTPDAYGFKDWSEVTCLECRIEMPLLAEPEPARTPMLSEVAAERAMREHERIKEVELLVEVLGDALADANGLLARLRGTGTAQNAPAVPVEGLCGCHDPARPQADHASYACDAWLGPLQGRCLLRVGHPGPC